MLFCKIQPWHHHSLTQIHKEPPLHPIQTHKFPIYNFLTCFLLQTGALRLPLSCWTIKCISDPFINLQTTLYFLWMWQCDKNVPSSTSSPSLTTWAPPWQCLQLRNGLHSAATWSCRHTDQSHPKNMVRCGPVAVEFNSSNGYAMAICYELKG